MPLTSFAGVSGTPRSAAELHGLIEKIDLLILNLLSEEGYDAGASYKIADRSVSRTEYLRWLLETRREYVQELTRLGVWEPTVLHP
jgi:hypothetical protein